MTEFLMKFALFWVASIGLYLLLTAAEALFVMGKPAGGLILLMFAALPLAGLSLLADD